MLTPALSDTLPAFFTLAQLFSCTPQPLPPVEVNFINVQHTVNNNVTLSELQRMQSETHVAQSPDEALTTVGTTESDIATTMDIGFGIVSNQFSGDSCLSFSHVKVNVTYTPKVAILRDYRPGSCRYQTTYEHELRHVTTNILVIHDFLPLFRNKLEAVLGNLRTRGPFPTRALDAQQKEMQETVQAELTAIADEMNKARVSRQQQVDTYNEYMRLTSACPHEPAVTR